MQYFWRRVRVLRHNYASLHARSRKTCTSMEISGRAELVLASAQDSGDRMANRFFFYLIKNPLIEDYVSIFQKHYEYIIKHLSNSRSALCILHYVIMYRISLFFKYDNLYKNVKSIRLYMYTKSPLDDINIDI